MCNIYCDSETPTSLQERLATMFLHWYVTSNHNNKLTSQGGAIDFIERLDRTSLTISDEDFEKNVEASVSAIAEPHLRRNEAAAQAALLVPNAKAEGSSPRSSSEAPRLPNRPSTTKATGSSKNEGESEENAAVAGLLRTIQRPLSTIGRIFSDDSSVTPNPPPPTQPPTTPQPPPPSQRRSPLPGESGKLTPDSTVKQAASAEDSAARQASQEAEEARRIRAREEAHVVETLCGMFPALDKDIVVDVVRANEGR
jgi:Rab5 GDP/GTP exchange factor